MPRYDRRLKRLVRERMAVTGERYTAARAAVVSERPLRLVWDPLMATLEIGEACWCDTVEV